MANTRFLPWIRHGLGALLTEVDPGGGQPLPASRGSFAVGVQISGTATATVGVDAHLLGPSDVVGIDARQVLRVEPRAGSTDLEPNYLPSVEFDQPDFPWLFTPAAATSGHQLRPWIVLVVVPRDAVELAEQTDRLAVARIDDAADQLPDLAQSWAWAHAQIAGPGVPADLLRSGDPARTLSRLVCPRKLAADTAYVALVVPAFESGRLAGLGKLAAPVPSADPLHPAWTSATGPVELPIYHRWEFRTGGDGDFEALAGRLVRVRLEPGVVGGATLAVAGVPAGLPAVPPLVFRGPLGVAGSTVDDPQPGSDFTTKLATLLDAQPPLPPGGAPASATAGLPLPPPVYGRWPAASTALPASGWLRELNLSLPLRAAAGLGARVVREQQEQLMAAAWAQAEDVVRVNQALRQAQLARAVGGAVYDGVVKTADPAMLIMLAGPAADRVRHDGRTVTARVAASRVPAAMVRPAFRRLTRRRGPLAKASAVEPGRLLGRVDDGTLPVVPPRRSPNDLVGVVTVNSLMHTRLCELDAAYLGRIARPADPQRRIFFDAAMQMQRNLTHCDPRPPDGPGPLDLSVTATAIRDALDPDDTVKARICARVTRPVGWKPADPLEPVLTSPRFPTPMWRSIAAISEELLLPGVGKVPPNSVSAVATNSRVVEAFMVGLNAEMARELLWRGFPTEQRDSCFRQFWDPAARVPALPADEREDVPPAHEWLPLAGSIGTHLHGEQFVLLLRGELLRRYPRTVVYLAEAEWYDNPRHEPTNPDSRARLRRPRFSTAAPGGAGYPEVYPLFSGHLVPDITFLGFPAPPSRADIVGDQDPVAGKPGWFVVLQQQPTELRFGLDENAPDQAAVTGTWRDLSWPNVARTNSGHVDLSKQLIGSTVTQPGGLVWGAGSTSAQLAAILTQQPVRAAMHGSDLIVAGSD